MDDNDELLETLVDTREDRPQRVESTPNMVRQQQLCCELWNLLVLDAKWDDELNEWVWEGKISLANEHLQISQPYYQMIYTHLQRMGCVEVVKRGGGGRGSTLALRQEPNDYLWQYGNKRTHSRATQRTQAQQIRDLAARIERLEQMAHIHPEGD